MGGGACTFCFQTVLNSKEQAFDIDGIHLSQGYLKCKMLPNDRFLIDYFSQKKWDTPGSEFWKRPDTKKYFFGRWVDGVPEGQGLIYEEGKAFIYSYFKQGIADGPSRLIFFQTGKEYIGGMLCGFFHGKGTLIDSALSIVFRGQWIDSKPTEGTLLFQRDQNIQKIEIISFAMKMAKIYYRDGRVYEGDFDRNTFKPHGIGKVMFTGQSRSSFYTGEWEDGVFEGEGEYHWKNGQSYTGAYENGLKNGRGRFRFRNGTVYEGEWAEGLQDGQGMLIGTDGQITKQGPWKRGVFVNEQQNKKVIQIAELSTSMEADVIRLKSPISRVQ